MKNRFLLIFLLSAFCTGLSAQSTAEEIENLLAAKAVTYAQASRFVLEASGKMVTYNPHEAFEYALEKNWLPDKVSADQSARLDDISLLILNAFDIKGGIFYSIANNSHYAYRELEYRNHIQGRADPAMDVRGELLLFIISSVLSEYDKNPAREDTLIADQAAQREEATRREAELAAQRKEAARQRNEQAAKEETARREAELAAQGDEAARQRNEQAAREEAARREAELAVRREAELAVQGEEARLRNEQAAREEAARREVELAAQREEATRREAELAAQREEQLRQQTAREAASRRDIKFPAIMFINNSTELRDSEKAKLREIAGTLKNMPGVKLMIYGHTAFAGTRAGRTVISLRRAQNVAYYLISLGAVDSANITTVSYGADRPIANNTTPQGMAANRRVEIIILED